MIDVNVVAASAPVAYRKYLMDILFRFNNEEHDEIVITVLDTSDPDHVPLNSITTSYISYEKAFVQRLAPDNPRQLTGCWIQIKTKGRHYPFVRMGGPTAPGTNRGIIIYDRGRVSSEFDVPTFSCDDYALYTGIGSRGLRGTESSQLMALSKMLAQHRLLPRSGHAFGADYVIELGAREVWPTDRAGPEIYLPYNGFNQGKAEEDPWLIDSPKMVNYAEAERIARDIHPYGRNLKGFALAAHIRNVFQVLGPDLKSPSLFLLCCADPLKRNSVAVKGGTGTAVKLAELNNIEIYNLRTRPFAEIHEALSVIRA